MSWRVVVTCTPFRPAFCDPGVFHPEVEFGADEVVVVPQRRVALLRAPLVVAEDDHGDGRPFVSTAGCHLVH